MIRLPRHSSFMIMHTFADWGNTGQNKAESIGNTTVSTTKAHGLNWDKGKGQILRSTPNTAPLICGACNTQPEGLSTMA